MTTDHRTIARDILRQPDSASATLRHVDTGMSEASVYRAQGGGALRYIKVASGRGAAALRDEIGRTQWLGAQSMPVPELLRIDDRGNRIAVLMTAMAGVPADISALPTPLFVTALATALAALHALPSDACPFDEDVAVRLARADQAIAAGEIDANDFDPRNRLTAPADLLQRLRQEQPPADIVVLHGDLTLANIIIDDNGTLGFIDCGNAGHGDRYIDLALLHADIVAHRGEMAGAQFLEAYSARDFDVRKARYFLDLYELF